MNRLFTNYLSALLLFFISVQLWGQIPADYYNGIEGKKDKELKTALYKIVTGSGFNVVGYNNLWNAYKSTDKRSDGKVWDMYSATSNFTFDVDKDGGSGGTTEGDKYNREHSFPQSWFENATGVMKSDLFNAYPTDKLVNNKRSNYPYGETNGNSYKSNNGFSKLGSCTFEGYTGTVFEPNDEYKGDFARSYFYIATCYENVFANMGGDMVAKNSYPGYKEWAVNLLLKWSRQDPVSKKETDRNNAVQKQQKNRNPFIDYPQLVEYIWGDKKGQAFSFSPSAIDGTELSPVFVSMSEGKVKVETNDKVQVSVYNICGKLLAEGEGQFEIYLPATEKGILLVKVKSDLKVITYKIRN